MAIISDKVDDNSQTGCFSVAFLITLLSIEFFSLSRYLSTTQVMNKLIVLCFVIVYLPLFANARECSVFEIKCGNICVDVKNWEVCQCCSEIVICCTTNSDCDENIRFVSKDKSYHGMQNVIAVTIEVTMRCFN